MIHPTTYGELNGVLAWLLDGARDALGANFIGAYLGPVRNRRLHPVAEEGATRAVAASAAALMEI